MAVDEPGHDDHPRSIDGLDVTIGQVRPDFHDLIALDEDVSSGEVTDRRVEAENDPTLDQLATRRDHAEVGPRRIESRQLGRFGRPAPNDDPSRPAVVALHQLLDVPHLEQDDPDQHQNTDHHRPDVRRKAVEREHGDDHCEEDGGDHATEEGGTPPGEGCATEHGSRDAVQCVAGPDLRITDPGTGHHEQCGYCGE